MVVHVIMKSEGSRSKVSYCSFSNSSLAERYCERMNRDIDKEEDVVYYWIDVAVDNTDDSDPDPNDCVPELVKEVFLVVIDNISSQTVAAAFLKENVAKLVANAQNHLRLQGAYIVQSTKVHHNDLQAI